ncbi:MAG TPA: hypothetical protein VF113_11200, partial [Stellaceae bacterium]
TGTVALNVDAGTITQTGGSITASSLTGESAGSSLLTQSNAISNLGTFSLAAGNFTLNDGATALAINGAVTVPGTLTLNAASITEQTGGTVNAGSLAGTSAGDVALDQPGNAVHDLGTFTLAGGNFNLNDGATPLTIDGAVTVPGTLTLTTGSITEQTGGMVNAGTLTGTSAGDVALALPGNVVNDLGTFNLTGGNLTLNDGATPLTIDGAVIVSGTLTLNAGSITEQPGGTINAGTLAGTSAGDVALAQFGNVVHDLGTFSVTSGDFTLNNGLTALIISGAVSVPDTNTLTLSATGITETTGSLSAGTLTGSSSSLVIGLGAPVSLTSRDNAIKTLSDWSTNGGSFTLNDSVPLTLTGNVSTLFPGFVFGFPPPPRIGGALSLSAASLTLSGSLSSGTGTTTLNSGSTITEAGGTISAVTLTGTSHGTVDLTSVGNAITTLGDFSTNGGAFNLLDGSPLAVAGNVVTNNGALSLTIPSLSLSGSLDSGSAATTLSAAGSITETSSGIITAGQLTGTSSGGTALSGDNLIARLGPFTNTGGDIVLSDKQPLTITAAVDAGANNLTLNVAGKLGIEANIRAGGTVSLNATGAISGTGAITAHTLMGSSAGGASLDSSSNHFSILSGFTNTGSGDVLIRDTGPLMLSGTLTNAAGGIFIRTTGEMMLGAASLSAPGGVELGSTGFTQTANVSVSTPLVVIDVTGAALPQTVNPTTAASLLASFEPGGGSGNISLATLSAPNAAVLLSANSGNITGTIDARALAVIGSGGSAQLFGNVDGIAGSTAAQAVGKSGRRENNYRFNNCAIGSVTCTVLPEIIPIQPAPISNVSILTQQQFTDPTINLLNVGTEDLY